MTMRTKGKATERRGLFGLVWDQRRFVIVSRPRVSPPPRPAQQPSPPKTRPPRLLVQLGAVEARCAEARHPVAARASKIRQRKCRKIPRMRGTSECIFPGSKRMVVRGQDSNFAGRVHQRRCPTFPHSVLVPPRSFNRSLAS